MGANKARGTRWETTVVNYLRSVLHRSTDVYRPAQVGFQDVGDIHLAEDFILQCKDWEKWSKADLWRFTDAANLQAIHAGRPWGVAVVKRRRDGGTGSTGSVDTATVAMDLATFGEIVSDLVEGREAINRLEELEDKE